MAVDFDRNHSAASNSFFINCQLKIHTINRDDNLSMYGVYISTCVINCLLAVIAVFGNGVVIVAVAKTPALHIPSYILLCCLAVTDFLTGALSQPVYIASNVAAMNDAGLYCIVAMIAYLVSFFLSGISFLILTLINCDRYICLNFPLRYNQLMTNRRALSMVAFCCAITGLFLVLPIIGENDTFEAVVTVVIVVNLATNVSICFGIFRVIRKHETRIEAERQLSVRLHQGSREDFGICKKSSRTAMFISALYFLCYAPYLGVAIVLAVDGEENMALQVRVAWNITATIVYLNACVNPIVYCYRMRDIRLAVHKILIETLMPTNLKFSVAFTK